MMKLGVGALYKNLGQVRSWEHNALGAHLPKCGVRLRRWENQRRLFSFEIILKYFISDVTAALIAIYGWSKSKS